ncbi:hypothetical protein [Frigidibacter albus]|nr:hypothetical protein [Frigidibacter albus]
MRFAPYPPFWVTMLLASAIYVNFFAQISGRQSLGSKQAPYKNPRQTSTPTTSAAVTTSAKPEAAARSST